MGFLGGGMILILDNSDISRIDNVNELINQTKTNFIAIDHHDNVEPFEGLYCFPGFASTTEIIYELIELAGFHPDEQTAIALYTGVIMDTGHFKYNKTTSHTHKVASKLMQYKINTEQLYRNLFEDYPLNALFVKKEVYSTLEVFTEFKTACVCVYRNVLDKYGFYNNPTEGIVSELLGPKDISVGISFTETKQGKIKISFRSKGDIDVCSIAKIFGGGGHKNASGAMLSLPLEEAKKKILELVRRLIKETNAI